MPLNKQRVSYASAALRAYRKAKKETLVDEADARDLMCDLMHLMDRDHKDVSSELRMARANFEAEAGITASIASAAAAVSQ